MRDSFLPVSRPSYQREKPVNYPKTHLLLLLAAIVVCAPLWLTEWLPMVDLPQHAAQAAMLKDLLVGSSAHSDVLRLNFFTPYLFGTTLLSALMTFMTPAEASRWVVAASMAGMIFATARLLSRCGGDIRLAPLTALGLYGFAFHWGFLNFLVAAPLGVLAISFLLDRERVVVRDYPALAAVGFIILFFCHALIAALVIGVHLLRVAATMRAWRPLVIQLAPLVPCGVFMVFWILLTRSTEAQVAGPVVWHFGTHRLTNLPILVLGASSAPVMLTGALLGLALILGGFRPTREILRWIPAVVVLGVLMLVPNVLFGNAFTYQRFAIFLVPFLALAIDHRPSRADRGIGRFQRHAAFATATLLGLHVAIVSLNMVGFARESAGFRTVLSAASPGGRAVQMSFQRRSLFSPMPVYLHFGSWYAAEKHGIVDFSFSEFAVAVVRYRDEQRPIFPSGFEWTPGAFVELSKSPRISDYRYVFLHSRLDVTDTLFANLTPRPTRVSEAGPWKLYRVETKRSLANAVLDPPSAARAVP